MSQAITVTTLRDEKNRVVHWPSRIKTLVRRCRTGRSIERTSNTTSNLGEPTMTDAPRQETPAEEDARLEQEQERYDALVSQRVSVLTNEGLGDQLAGSLAVLLDPAMQVTREEREAMLIDNVLHLVAQREIDKQLALQSPDSSK